MLIPKPLLVFFFSKSKHELLSERLSEHEKSGIEMKEGNNFGKKQVYATLNDSLDEEEINTYSKKKPSHVNFEDFDG
jgi:hypothetical protein